MHLKLDFFLRFRSLGKNINLDYGKIHSHIRNFWAGSCTIVIESKLQTESELYRNSWAGPDICRQYKMFVTTIHFQSTIYLNSQLTCA